MTSNVEPMFPPRQPVEPSPFDLRWRLGTVSAGRDNNFNLIRIIAAACVIVSHAFPIMLGRGAVEPMEHSTGLTLGWIAVAVFFAISGFLITRSFDRTSHVSRWISARVMRLFPGLVVVLFLTALCYGPTFTALPLASYFSSSETYSYVPRNLSLAFLQFGLPGVLTDVPYPGAINGSLWTLMHEVACYAGVFLLGIVGALRSRRAFLIFVLTYIALLIVGRLPAIEPELPHTVLAFRNLSYPFVLGMALYHWRDRVALSWGVAAALGVLAYVTRNTAAFDLVFVAAIAYTTFVMAYRVGGAVRRYNDLGDYSYGLYIYGFPAQQAVAQLGWARTPLENMAVAFPIALSFAVLSWYLVEHPALQRRNDIADWFVRHLAALTGVNRGAARS